MRTISFFTLFLLMNVCAAQNHKATDQLSYSNVEGVQIHIYPLNRFVSEGCAIPPDAREILADCDLLILESNIFEIYLFEEAAKCPKIDPEIFKTAFDSLEFAMIEAEIADTTLLHQVNDVLYSRPLMLEWFFIRNRIENGYYCEEYELQRLIEDSDIEVRGFSEYCERFEHMNTSNVQDLAVPIKWLQANKTKVPAYFEKMRNSRLSEELNTFCESERSRIGSELFNRRFQEPVLTWLPVFDGLSHENIFIAIDFRFLCPKNGLPKLLESIGYERMVD